MLAGLDDDDDGKIDGMDDTPSYASARQEQAERELQDMIVDALNLDDNDRVGLVVAELQSKVPDCIERATVVL